MRALLGVLMLVGWMNAAAAADMQVEVSFPADFSAAPDGKGDVALKVEDARDDDQLGKSADGEPLQPTQDLAKSLYDLIAADLKQAGFNVVSYAPGSPQGLIIRIDSLKYSENRNMFKTRAEVKCALVVDMASVDTTYTFRSSVSDEYAWKPTADKRGALIGKALAGALQAAFDEPDIDEALGVSQ
ncbi:MAG TPA: YajG family lipoprotein [Mariprofundaceae bacterium]|nr:YajG family lipoprotein [Mariprofundaceae bacterium]